MPEKIPFSLTLDIGGKETLTFKRTLVTQGGEYLYSLMVTPSDLQSLQYTIDQHFPRSLEPV